MVRGMKRSLLVTLLALSLPVLGASALACSGTAQEAPQAQTQAGLTLAPVGASTQGPVRIAGTALGEVPLRPSQRVELEQLATAADARHVKVHAAAKDVVLAFADQVEKGQIDRAALKPKIDVAVGAFETSRPEDRAAIQRTHDLLDAEQRAKFADALHAQVKEARAGHHKAHHLMALAAELGLTDEQKAKIFSVLKDARHAHAKGHAGEAEHGKRDHHEHGRKAMEAFRSDGFKIDEAMPKHDVKDKVEKGQARFFDAAEKILPILTPEQRTLAAAKLREKANTSPAELLHH